MWIMTSDEYLEMCVTNKTGKNAGKRSIWFNGKRMNSETGQTEEYTYPRFVKYLEKDFSRLIND